MELPDIDWDRVDNAFKEISKGVNCRPGPDWFTTQEYSQKFGLPDRTARDRLEKLNKAGVVEKKKAFHSQNYYRIK